MLGASEEPDARTPERAARADRGETRNFNSMSRQAIQCLRYVTSTAKGL